MVRRCAVVIMAVALSVLAGCAGHAANPETDRLEVRRLPGESALVDLLLEWAETLLSGRCMASRGYEFIVDWPYDDLAVASGPYGSDDVESAATVGFGIGPHRSSTMDDPNQKLVARLTPARQADYTAAMFGAANDQAKVTLPDGSIMATGRSGCLADARRALFGQDLDGWFRLDVWASNIQERILSAVLGEADYGRALDNWRTCMRDRGYDSHDPAAARDQAALAYERLDHDHAWQTEQHIAVAAATCVRRSSLLSTGERLQTAITNTVLAGSQADAGEYERRRADALREARRLRGELVSRRNGS